MCIKRIRPKQNNFQNGNGISEIASAGNNNFDSKTSQKVNTKLEKEKDRKRDEDDFLLWDMMDDD